MVSGRRCDAVENRQRILRVAKELFATQGLEQTNMQAIAKAAEVGQGTLYRSFANKGALCEALFAEDMESFRSRADNYFKAHAADGALERLEWLLTEKIAFMDEHLPLFFTSHECALGNNEAFKKSHHVWMVEQVKALLSEAKAKGETNVEDVAFAADAILASFSPPLLAYQRNDLGYSLARITAGITHVFIAGIRTQSVTPTSVAAPRLTTALGSSPMDT